MSYKSANCIGGKHADCAWYGICGDLCTCDCHTVDGEAHKEKTVLPKGTELTPGRTLAFDLPIRIVQE